MAYLSEHGVSLTALVRATGFDKIAILQDASDAMCVSLEVKKSFQTYANELKRLMKFADRDDVSAEDRANRDGIVAIYDELQKKRRHSDNTDLMVQINHIISEHIRVAPQTAEAEKSRQFDISSIDFELLRREFARTRRKNLLIRDLQELIQQRLSELLFTNPNRIDYYERYQAIIDSYNAEQNRATIEKTFMDLMNLAKSMNIEQQRYVQEGFSSDEELSVYDLLFKEDLSNADIQKVKKVAADLLKKVKERIAALDHWTDKQETKAVVDNLIRYTLWTGLPECYDEISISQYRQKLYEYVYTRYKDVA